MNTQVNEEMQKENYKDKNSKERKKSKKTDEFVSRP